MAKRKPVAPPKRRKASPPGWSDYGKNKMMDKKEMEAFLSKHFGRGKRKPGQRAPGPRKSTKNYMTPMKKKARKK